MGGDGGSIPHREELVRSKKKPERAARNAANAARWCHCALSQDSVRQPIVSCQLGRLFNKESIINKLLHKTALNNTADHIKKLKDVRELQLHVNKRQSSSSEAPYSSEDSFYCPITGLEMSGLHQFVYFWKCGCVFSKRAVDAVHDGLCMMCGQPFTSEEVILLNPQTEEEVAAANERLLTYRANSLRKTKKRPAAVDTAKSDPASESVCSKKPKDGNAPTTATTSKRPSTKQTKSIQEDPGATSVYKSLFTTSEQAKRQPKAHWVTFNPLYFR